MKPILMTALALSPTLICVGVAGALAIMGKDGWWWFLIAAPLVGYEYRQKRHPKASQPSQLDTK